MKEKQRNELIADVRKALAKDGPRPTTREEIVSNLENAREKMMACPGVKKDLAVKLWVSRSFNAVFNAVFTAEEMVAFIERTEAQKEDT